MQPFIRLELPCLNRERHPHRRGTIGEYPLTAPILRGSNRLYFFYKKSSKNPKNTVIFYSLTIQTTFCFYSPRPLKLYHSQKNGDLASEQKEKPPLISQRRPELHLPIRIGDFSCRAQFTYCGGLSRHSFSDGGDVRPKRPRPAGSGLPWSAQESSWYSSPLLSHPHYSQCPRSSL